MGMNYSSNGGASQKGRDYKKKFVHKYASDYEKYMKNDTDDTSSGDDDSSMTLSNGSLPSLSLSAGSLAAESPAGYSWYVFATAAAVPAVGVSTLLFAGRTRETPPPEGYLRCDA